MSTHTESAGPDQAVATAPAARTKVWIAIAVAGVLAGLVIGWFVTRDDEAPYTDPAATGTLTFCDAQGKEVVEGSVKDAPFADLAVGSSGVDAQFGEGGNATLFAYQPREGVSPEEFSGGLLTKATPLVDVKHPFAVISSRSTTLADFTAGYPATWDGYVQLRLLVAAPGSQAPTDYNAADIRIDGDHWKLVTGGGGDCRSTARTAAKNVTP
ncbi:hypothetical protein ABIE44_002666 [Marmoricola sp. OAE513]|uniref:hypothetical protein n=1 Tax=Marmoricola sp. OAE513 TaxID=2817894 RepID=UPI001AE1AEF3